MARNNTNRDDDDVDEDNDVTRFYPTVDSQDTSMERRIWPQHELDLHCEPMADWQTTFYPVCNELHATASMTDSFIRDDLQLLSSKGFWRHAWQMDHEKANHNITTVLKTLKCVDTSVLAEQYCRATYLCASIPTALQLTHHSPPPFLVLCFHVSYTDSHTTWRNTFLKTIASTRSPWND
jgi:hypothetical protein